MDPRRLRARSTAGEGARCRGVAGAGARCRGKAEHPWCRTSQISWEPRRRVAWRRALGQVGPRRSAS